MYRLPIISPSFCRNFTSEVWERIQEISLENNPHKTSSKEKMKGDNSYHFEAPPGTPSQPPYVAKGTPKALSLRSLPNSFNSLLQFCIRLLKTNDCSTIPPTPLSPVCTSHSTPVPHLWVQFKLSSLLDNFLLNLSIHDPCPMVSSFY